MPQYSSNHSVYLFSNKLHLSCSNFCLSSTDVEPVALRSFSRLGMRKKKRKTALPFIKIKQDSGKEHNGIQRCAQVIVMPKNLRDVNKYQVNGNSNMNRYFLLRFETSYRKTNSECKSSLL